MGLRPILSGNRIDASRLVFIDETWVKINNGSAARLGPVRTTAYGIRALWPLEDYDVHSGASL